jgi:hypothetical protein
VVLATSCDPVELKKRRSKAWRIDWAGSMFQALEAGARRERRAQGGAPGGVLSSEEMFD